VVSYFKNFSLVMKLTWKCNKTDRGTDKGHSYNPLPATELGISVTFIKFPMLHHLGRAIARFAHIFCTSCNLMKSMCVKLTFILFWTCLQCLFSLAVMTKIGAWSSPSCHLVCVLVVWSAHFTSIRQFFFFLFQTIDVQNA
jgi:hypothetical protein